MNATQSICGPLSFFNHYDSDGNDLEENFSPEVRLALFSERLISYITQYARNLNFDEELFQNQLYFFQLSILEKYEETGNLIGALNEQIADLESLVWHDIKDGGFYGLDQVATIISMLARKALSSAISPTTYPETMEIASAYVNGHISSDELEASIYWLNNR